MKRQKGAVMKQFDFVVQALVGIHARPAMQLVNEYPYLISGV